MSITSKARKKAAAEAHNALYVEKQAYAEDRARDPDKYRCVTVSSSPSRAALIAAATLATYGEDFPIYNFKE